MAVACRSRHGDTVRLFLVLAVGAAGACGQSPVEVDGTCVAVVNVDGVYMTTEGGVVPVDSVGVPYLTVGRSTGCLDQGEPNDPLGPGESNFLEAGTELRRVAGYEATERLAYRIDSGEWLAVSALDGHADVTLAIGDEIVVPGGVLRVGLAGVAADSRCPVDVTCVWEGDLEVDIDLTLGSGPTTRHRLHLTSSVGETSVEHGGYLVRLVSVAPTPVSTTVIEPREYRVRLIVEELAVGS